MAMIANIFFIFFYFMDKNLFFQSPDIAYQLSDLRGTRPVIISADVPVLVHQHKPVAMDKIVRPPISIRRGYAQSFPGKAIERFLIPRSQLPLPKIDPSVYRISL